MKTEEGITAFKDWVSVGGGPTVLSYFNDVKDVTIKGYKDIMTENGHLDFISSLPLKILYPKLLLRVAKGARQKSSE